MPELFPNIQTIRDERNRGGEFILDKIKEASLDEMIEVTGKRMRRRQKICCKK
ncbi:MAG: hypothetical protein OJF59_001353 [Cytophagales bacterium]|jgi:hypothetical protein|nr:MAG: hypothetical protein OJF59_001353 [Cytophagales bacterium]